MCGTLYFPIYLSLLGRSLLIRTRDKFRVYIRFFQLELGVRVQRCLVTVEKTIAGDRCLMMIPREIGVPIITRCTTLLHHLVLILHRQKSVHIYLYEIL